MCGSAASMMPRPQCFLLERVAWESPPLHTHHACDGPSRGVDATTLTAALPSHSRAHTVCGLPQHASHTPAECLAYFALVPINSHNQHSMRHSHTAQRKPYGEASVPLWPGIITPPSAPWYLFSKAACAYTTPRREQHAARPLSQRSQPHICHTYVYNARTTRIYTLMMPACRTHARI